MFSRITNSHNILSNQIVITKKSTTNKQTRIVENHENSEFVICKQYLVSRSNNSKFTPRSAPNFMNLEYCSFTF